MDNFIYVNGEILPESQAKVSVKDRGLMYGDGVFETMRVYNGTIFRLQDHIDRLLDGLNVLKFDRLPESDEIQNALQQTIKANQWQDARVKLTVTRGCSDALTPLDCHPTVIVTGSPLESQNSRPWTAAVVDIRRDESSPISRIKSLNYLPSTVGLIEAREKGVDEGILLNRYGKIAEGTMSNIFLVKSGTLVTPSIESGALPGITRKVIIEIARSEGIEVEERTVERDELQEATEVFAVNSIIEVKAITSVDYRTVGSGSIGKLTSELKRRYSEMGNDQTLIPQTPSPVQQEKGSM